MTAKICRKPFRELSIMPGPTFSFCCSMLKRTWFHAASIREALSCKTAELVRKNACNNALGYCPEDCPHWEAWDGTMPEVRLERCEIAAGFQCNARCTFCFNSDFTARVSDEIIEEYKSFVIPTVGHLAFGGGEPLLVAIDLIYEAIAKQPNVRISLTTNGILLDKLIPIIDNVDGINVSFNAGSRESYKTVHGVDAFDRVVDNVKRLRKMGYTGPISSTFVICRENVHDVLNYVTVCKDIGADSAGFKIDQTDPFLRIEHDLREKIQERGDKVGLRVKFGRMKHDSSLMAKAKQTLLYYFRYRSRRRPSTVQTP